MNRIVGMLAIVLIAAHWTTAQDVEERLREAEKLLREQGAELELLREQVRGNAESATRSATQQSDLDAAIDRALDERLRTNFFGKKLTESGNPIRFYGAIRMDTYFNTARANSVLQPSFVLPENSVAATDNDDEIGFDMRLTRLGLDVHAGEIAGAEVIGKLEMDFGALSGGLPASRPIPRIRRAYVNMDFGNTFIRVGHDWDIISPLRPSLHEEMCLWNAGNLGGRREGVQLGFRQVSDGSEFGFVGGLLAAGAVGNTDLDAGVAPRFASTIRDGNDSGLPMVQARGYVKSGGLELGGWAHYAVYESDNSFPVGIGGTTHFRSYSIGVDMSLALTDDFELRGEAWVGQNLRDVLGGIGQGVNVGTGREIESAGGWVEARMQLTDVFRLSLGASLDDPRNDEVARGGARKNFTFYAATQHSWGGGLVTGFDVIYWETDWKDGGVFVAGGTGNMFRFNAYTQLSF